MIPYIGGKYRQAKWISSFIPDNIDTYIEVFGGAFWTYLNGNIDCKKSIYNDVNPFMANLFACCCIPDFKNKVEKELPQNRDTFDFYKKDIIEIFDNPSLMSIPDQDIGVKYAYCVTQIFSGIMNEKAKMVDLKGKYRSKYYAFMNRLSKPDIIKKFSKVNVHNLSYDEIINMYDNGNNFFYLDPPYYGTENLYGFHDFNISHHEHLSDILKKCKSKWILSYYDFPDLSKWFPKDKYHWELKGYKKASAAQKGKKQTDGEEILIMNF